MKIIRSLNEVRSKIAKIKSSGRKISLIPTMGNIHNGHLSLIKKSQNYESLKIVSIFVNPLQFDNSTDLANYPQTQTEDICYLSDAKIDYLFIPKRDEILTNLDDNFQLPWGFSNLLCGKFRKNHFNGVFAIVKRLFEIIHPNYVFFGEKDYQQSLLIKYIIENYYRSTELIVCPTMRNSDKLALSSRNSLIAKSPLTKISKLIDGLKKTCINYHSATGLKDFKKFYLRSDFCKTQYIEMFREDVLHEKHGVRDIGNIKKNNSRIFISVYYKNIRLIDNQSVEEYDNV